jgi:hypothetical protein
MKIRIVFILSFCLINGFIHCQSKAKFNCEDRICDTVNTYSLKFSNPDTTFIIILHQPDTIFLQNNYFGKLKITFWQCSYCKGVESAYISDMKQKQVHLFDIKYSGNTGESEIIDFAKLKLSPSNFYSLNWHKMLVYLRIK